MKGKFFINVVANAVLIIIVCGLSIFTLSSASTSVFNGNAYSPIYRGGGNNVSLMINVYWGAEYLADMLAIFDKYQVKTTFFVGGCWVAKNPDILCDMVSRGHEIGNHGYYHKAHSDLTFEQNKTEILSTEKVIWQLCSVRTTLFAPPSGDFSSDTLKAAEELGYTTVMWSRDTIDWRDKDSAVVYERATKNTVGGELILMHPTQHTLQALEKIVQYYINNGFCLTTVSENILAAK